MECPVKEVRELNPTVQAAVNQAKTFYGMKPDGECNKNLWIKLGIDPAIF